MLYLFNLKIQSLFFLIPRFFGKKALFAFSLIFLVFHPLHAQEDEFEDDFFEETEIACPDLPSAFSKYNKDMHLNQLALRQALSKLSNFLTSLSQNRDSFSKSDILRKKEQLEQAIAKAQSNEFHLSVTGADIDYFLKECLTPTNEISDPDKS